MNVFPKSAFFFLYTFFHTATLLGQVSTDKARTGQLNKVSSTSSVKKNSIAVETGRQNKDTLNIVAVGDIMLGTHYPNSSYLPPQDGKQLLQYAQPVLTSADIAFGNLEGTFLSEGLPTKKCNDPKKCYVFKMPDHYADHFKAAGFDLLSLANNHSLDFGEKGTTNTMKLLTERGIAFAGLKKCPTAIIQVNGQKIGFAAFAPNAGTISFNDHALAAKIVKQLDSTCDLVIVSFHGGAEGTKYNRITRTNELFLGENRGDPYHFARVVIDAGADLVLGHGPHVPRAFDLYKNRFIAYSMGNFATYGRFGLTGSSGFAPMVEIKINTNGEFISGKIHAMKQVGEGGPIPDEKQNALQEIKRLTAEDIPECKLVFSPDGSFYADMVNRK